MNLESVSTFTIAATLASGLFALWTAWYNGRKTDHSFKIALYERRFNLYLEYLTFLQEVVRCRQVSQELTDRFERIFDQSRFLFDPSLVDSLRLAWEQAQLLEEVTQELKSGAAGDIADDQLADLCKRQEQLNDWFIGEKSRCRERFARYLTV